MNSNSFLEKNLEKKKTTHFIFNKDDLSFLNLELSKSKVIGLDTEFDWRTTYFPNLSLIQIATEKTFSYRLSKSFTKKNLKNNI